MHQALQKLKVSVRPPAVALQQIGENGPLLSIRPVYPQADLQIFYQWMEDPDLRVNWGLKENKHRLETHYALFLETEDRQSFLVEKSDLALFQFDIFLIHFHELCYRIPTGTGDCIMNFLILLREDTREDLKKAISLQLDYFFSYPGCKRLWTPVPEEEEELKSIFSAAGFTYRISYTAKQQRFALFYQRRSDYMERKYGTLTIL